jgi:hypothetical protein
VRISFDAKLVTQYSKKIYSAAEKAARKALAKSAYRVMQGAKALIERDESYSEPGMPPHTRRGQLRSAIRYTINYRLPDAVIGPTASGFAQAGQVHEFGGTFMGGEYPARPFMRPALNDELDNFAGGFAGSIGE